ncbi:hypothetical protein ABMA28_014368 [Loxostege sticticalis]|uniref:C-type lectin domain-containing protein n=1 Tax=Loxostege sticticalis TaxID=481309 RepID=A0ABD0TGJ8_LOXSC
MARNKLIFYYLSLLVMTISYSQRDKKNFRKDYKYVEATESFYKFHTMSKKGQDAKDMCELEGATIFYPEDQNEADAIRQLWNETQVVLPRIYIGVASWIVKGVFETFDGRPINDVYSNWAPGEPNNANDNEDCVIMRRDGTLNDVNCNDKNPFVCKKTISSLEWNTNCDMPNLAYATCNAEQSYLAIVDSQAEADHLTRMTASALRDNVQGNLEQPAVFLGFHKRRGVWSTTKGTKLVNSGYSKWGNQQPDGGDNETCGAMFYTGLLQDLKCDLKCFFICEHDVANLSNVFDDRYGATQ